MKTTLSIGLLAAAAAAQPVLPEASRAGWFNNRIDSTVDINASPEVVWQVLTDFNSYPEWNPFFRSVKGSAQVNTKLAISAELAGSRQKFTFKPRVLVADSTKQLRWRGRMIMPGLFDGEHWFIFETISPNLVRVHHSEAFSGLLVPFLKGSILPKTRISFGEMNAALKARAEGAQLARGI